MDPHVPNTVLKDWLRIDKQFQRAEERFDTPDGEFEVGRAVSLQAAFTTLNAFLGLGVRYGGWKGQKHRHAENQKWIERAHELLGPLKKPYPRGTKSRIANQIANEFGAKFDAVRKCLRKSGVWQDATP